MWINDSWHERDSALQSQATWLRVRVCALGARSVWFPCDECLRYLLPINTIAWSALKVWPRGFKVLLFLSAICWFYWTPTPNPPPGRPPPAPYPPTAHVTFFCGGLAIRAFKLKLWVWGVWLQFWVCKWVEGILIHQQQQLQANLNRNIQ